MSNPLNALLHEMLETSQDILAITIVSKDGLIIATAVENGYNEELLAGMASQMSMLGERVMNELLNKSPQKIILEAAPHEIILVQAGEEASILTVALKRSIGITLLTIERLARSVEKILTPEFG